MRYVALLRGINVGGKNRVPMQQLRQIFATCGCINISTYINSGNVIFTDNREESALIPLIETALYETFDSHIPVQIRNLSELRKLCESIPQQWTNDSVLRTDVLFLDDSVNNDSFNSLFSLRPELGERALKTNREFVWHIPREHVRKGSIIKLINTEAYAHLTIRNINTVRKIATLLDAD